MSDKIDRKDLLRLSFYKKTHYSGSFKGMRYRIERREEETGEEKKVFFRAWIYPEPYSFEATDDAKKEYKDFPFTEEAIDDIKDWLDESYAGRKSEWSSHNSHMSSGAHVYHIVCIGHCGHFAGYEVFHGSIFLYHGDTHNAVVFPDDVQEQTSG